MDKGFGREWKALLAAQPELRDALRQIEPMLTNRRETIWMMSPVATRFRN